jgi:monofunctional biosynthetic peptidoglycan transglycosylase
MAIKRTPKKRKAAVPRIRNRFMRWTLLAALYFFAITIGWVIVLRFVNPPLTWLMVQRAVERKSDGKEWKITKKWVKYEDLSDNLKRAALSGEDANFMKHWGFDRQAIQEAMERNKSGGALRGGSTISQQTAKNVFLWPGRSWVRKGFEVYFTSLIEVFWGKKRILEVYLNVIETGDGLYGAEAATQHYFGKAATSLTKREAALIIAVLPNPRRWKPNAPTNFINRKTSTIVRYIDHYEIP